MGLVELFGLSNVMQTNIGTQVHAALWIMERALTVGSCRSLGASLEAR